MIRRARPSFLSLPRRSAPASPLPAALALLVVAGCAATTDSTTSTATAPTSITVNPSSFLGSVACSNQPGALKSYVATLKDVTSTAPGSSFTLPSSPPTPCSQSVVFRYVQVGHEYTLTIDGYDALAADLTPCGGASSGSRYVFAADPPPVSDCAAAITAGSVPVKPRWTTGCSDVGSKPVTDETVIAACGRPLEGSGPLPAAQITVDPRSALGALQCAKAPDGSLQVGGTIAFFDIKADDANLNNYLGLACASFTAPKVYGAGLVPGATYTFHIAARDGTDTTASPTYVATCSAQARAGLTVPAICEPFSQP